ncbi:MAG: hypothetical protein BV456_08400 [Thermoplasmata archaeon M8B2D]|nr:MAG: hypothetical protein BV456_08400 [Thermoplasmata archaeon M8B2D]
MDFAHLHLHTEFSQLDGYGTAEEYVKRAKQLKYQYLGITDHGNIDGLITFQNECLDNGITPILGCEGYLIEDNSTRNMNGHITFWIKNNLGFKNLCSMLSIANLDNFYRKPLITFQNLRDHYKGLVIGTACLGSFVRKLPNGIKFFRELKKLLKNDLYLELMLNQLPEQIEHNQTIFQLAEETKTKIILTHDCHYVKKADSKYQEMMLAIQRKAKWDDPRRWKFDLDNLYLLSKREVKNLCSEYNTSIEYANNTLEIAEKCKRFRIRKREIVLPQIKGVHDEIGILRLMTDVALKKYNNTFPYLERLEKELDIIVKKGFERYILIVWELCLWCKDNNILMGPGRGSVGGSLIAFLLGITSVDPIKHNLLFERFISEERIDYPDIDLDFDRTKIPLIREHLENLYGIDNVANVSNFSKFKARGSIQDVSRVFGIEKFEVDRFTKFIAPDETLSEKEILDESAKIPEGKIYYQQYPEVLDFAKNITGRIRNYGQHAAGLIISPDKIEKSGRCNLIRGKKNIRINWEKNNAEYVGFVKLDVLPLAQMTVIDYCLKQIKANTGKDFNLYDIDLNYPPVLEEIQQGNNEGVFQLNTDLMGSILEKMEINSFQNLTHLMALGRPGPLNSGMVDEYIVRQQIGNWDRQHPIYEELTKDTFGLLIFQEQIMLVINKIAGLPYSTADKIRKIISKKRDKNKFSEYENLFMDGCKKTKIFSNNEAITFWENLQNWANYGFPKAHSVEYSMLSMWCATLKFLYPTEFISASLSDCSKTQKDSLVQEAIRLDLKLYPPKCGISHATQWIAKDHKLFIPFSEVEGLGPQKAEIAANNPNYQKVKKQLKFLSMENVAIKHKGKLGEKLELIKAYDKNDNELSWEAKALFDFDF